MTPLAIALSLICAYAGPSSQECATANTIPISIQAPSIPWATATYTDRPYRQIVVSERITQPAILADTIFHEVIHDGDYRVDRRRNKAFCRETEHHAFTRQREMWEWFVHSFGQPHETDGLTLDFNAISWPASEARAVANCESWA